MKPRMKPVRMRDRAIGHSTWWQVVLGNKPFPAADSPEAAWREYIFFRTYADILWAAAAPEIHLASH